jgi:hypothetical protein
MTDSATAVSVVGLPTTVAAEKCSKAARRTSALRRAQSAPIHGARCHRIDTHGCKLNRQPASKTLYRGVDGTTGRSHTSGTRSSRTRHQHDRCVCAQHGRSRLDHPVLTPELRIKGSGGVGYRQFRHWPSHVRRRSSKQAVYSLDIFKELLDAYLIRGVHRMPGRALAQFVSHSRQRGRRATPKTTCPPALITFCATARPIPEPPPISTTVRPAKDFCR